LISTVVRRELAAAADPDRAPAMQQYMKSDMPYHGVPRPDVRRICKAIFAEHRLASPSAFDTAVSQLFFEATHREERYAALQLAAHRRYRAYQTPSRIPLYRKLIVAGAWWDIVDEVAANLVGPILASHPTEVRPVVAGWATDADLWLRRTAIIAQLGAKARTDLDLLTYAIEVNVGDTDFFIRKAIGWALRQYARVDADWVRDFVAAHDGLSGLSKREALKRIGR
jgi:3-methyladenine DNA glycosylase AlkD